MKIHILMNALAPGDGVSSHCILLKQRAAELGVSAALYAASVHAEVQQHLSPLSELRGCASSDDILLHQFYNETKLIPYVEQFPGRRVMMYHNITPPEYFPTGSPTYLSCSGGLKQARSCSYLYDYAAGMSEFSRRDLEGMGYRETGVFPLLVDLAGLQRRQPNPVLAAQPKPARRVFLYVGRIAPNKRQDDLVRFLAAYRLLEEDACLILVGDREQHPHYTEQVTQLCRRHSLRSGKDVILAGKVPESDLVAYYLASDAFISMSEHEGFGAPLLESMVSGLPTFALARGACEETLGGAGVVFREKDFESIAGVVRDVLSDPRRKSDLIRAQLRRLEDFGPECQRRQLASLLDRVRGCARPAAAPLRVSVVINTYNRARLLQRCLATLADQTYRDFEVIVVNGPSTDDTPTVLSLLEGKVQVAQTDSRVLSVSRNEGILRSAGDLVAFIDDDAIADPHWLEELVPAFENPSVGAAGGLVYRMNGRDIEFRNGLLDREGFVRWDEPEPGLHRDWDAGYLNTVSGNNCIFRRSALETIGGFDERIEYYHDEADVVLRLRRAGFCTVHRPEAIVYHESAMSENRTSLYELNWFAITKNTLYCALKNYDGGGSLGRTAGRITGRLVAARMLPMGAWWRDRRIGLAALLRMEFACFRGIVTGIWRGLKPSPLHRPIGPVTADAQFHPLAAPTPAGLSVCLLSQSMPEESPGGIATYTSNLALGLRDLGCEVHIVTRGRLSRSEARDGIWYHRAAPVPLARDTLGGHDCPITAKNLEYSNGVWKTLLDIEARWGLDIVESPNWDAEGLLAALEHCRPVVVRTHSPMFKVMETQGWNHSEDLAMCCSLEGLLLCHADAVTGSTSALLDLIEQRFPVQDRRCLIPLGLAPPPASAGCARGRERRILYVGRLERRKGIHSLLEAIPRVLESSATASFEIVGRDSDCGEGMSWQERWEKDASPAFKDRVQFCGEVGEVELARFYEACDLFVAPSLYESFGLIYVEAMAHGKPVIACRAGGIPEVVADGETGLLVPPGDSGSLAGAILRLLGDEELMGRLGTAGRQRYLTHFTVEAMAKKTYALYRSVAEEWKARSVVAWRAGPMDFLRSPGCEVAWIPEVSRTCLCAGTGNARTIVYGPYVSLAPGSYRAEFKLWIAGAPQPGVQLGSVDVFSIKGGERHETPFWRDDFAAGSGSVFTIFFRVPDPAPDDYEFRVHTAGCVPVYIREIVVSRWPNASVERALATPISSDEALTPTV